MNNYRFEAWQRAGVGTCYVTVFRNDEVIEQYEFATPEWADAYVRLCERLNAIRIDHALGQACGGWRTRHKSLGELHASMFGASCDGIDSYFNATHVYTKEEVDALFQRITSLEHWLEPLRNAARRFFDTLMWGERGRA